MDKIKVTEQREITADEKKRIIERINGEFSQNHSIEHVKKIFSNFTQKIDSNGKSWINERIKQLASIYEIGDTSEQITEIICLDDKNNFDKSNESERVKDYLKKNHIKMTHFSISDEDKFLKRSVRLDLATNDLRISSKYTDLDVFVAKISRYFLDYYDLKMSEKNLKETILIIADKNRYNSITDMIDSFTLPSENPIDKFISYFYFSDESKIDIFKTIWDRWWLRHMIQLYAPYYMNFSYPNDLAICLEGDQGLQKGILCRALSLDQKYYLDMERDLTSKDSLMKQSGVLICELSEGKALKNEVDEVKRFVSTATLVYRKPYFKNLSTVNRTFSIIVTINDSSYLRDSTGNRRFCPIKISKPSQSFLNDEGRQIIQSLYAYYSKQAKNILSIENNTYRQEILDALAKWDQETEEYLNGIREDVTVENSFTDYIDDWIDEAYNYKKQQNEDLKKEGKINPFPIYFNASDCRSYLEQKHNIPLNFNNLFGEVCKKRNLVRKVIDLETNIPGSRKRRKCWFINEG